MSKISPTLLHPLQILEDDEGASCMTVILNMPLSPNLELLKKLWSKSVYNLTVDGGSNELYETLSKYDETFIPHCIIGDFDSLKPECQDFYQSKGVEICPTPDQDYNDFTKALRFISEKNGKFNIKATSIYVLGAFGGRMDQVFANIDALFNFNLEIQVYLISEGNLAVLHKEGRSEINVKSPFRDLWCGLIPIGMPCKNVTTKGLKWNLDGQTLKFGELISTSNTFESDDTETVIIETENPVLWTMGYVYPRQ